jgi:uncharacterized glyoxalase superfamily protein PhnB
MTGNTAHRGIPKGYTTVTPWIVSTDSARLVAFLASAFDAKEKEGTRSFNQDGSIAHVEVEIGDSVVMLFDAKHDWPETPAFLRVFVTDADGTYQRALDAGGRSVTKVTELASGERVGRVTDPCGNVWWIQTPAKEAAKDAEPRSRDPEMQEAVRYVEESLDDEIRKRKGIVIGPRGITVG